jgi:very-short-patch-repair endonuclease
MTSPAGNEMTIEQFRKALAESELVTALLGRIHQMDLPEPELEVRFHPERAWRFDLAWPACRLAVEVDGGVWTGGRHVRPVGFTEDCRKLNHAALLGWRILRFTTEMIESDEAVLLIEQAINSPPGIPLQLVAGKPRATRKE